MTDVEQTLAERGARYGDFTDHAKIAQGLQNVMHGRQEPFCHDGWDRLTPVKRQALTVIADKIARILTGDPEYTDNWHDIQGYAKLAEDRCVDSSTEDMFKRDAATLEAGYKRTAIFSTVPVTNLRPTAEKGYENGN